MLEDPEIYVPGKCYPCPSECDNVFARVVISFLLAGGTRVFFTLVDDFTDPRPYVFTLQVGQTENPDADDWEDVGAPITDMFFAVDGQQRLFGKIRWNFYRVKLETSKGLYYSPPTGLLGTLSRTDWRYAQNALNSETMYMQNGDGQLCYLLKRRVTGIPCPTCLDPQTQDIKWPYCPDCLGTSFLCGYFFPIGCCWADIDPKSYHVTQDMQRGTIADIVVKARMLNTWAISEDDIVVNKVTDDRYFVHSVKNAYEFRGVPISAFVELRLIAFSHPVYDIEIPDQLEPLYLRGRV